MTIQGERVELSRWIHSGTGAVHVEVTAITPSDDPSQVCLEPDTVRYLDELQRLAEAGNGEELSRHGDVFIRRSA